MSGKVPEKRNARRSLRPEVDFAGRQMLGAREEQQDSYGFAIAEGGEDGARRLLLVIADGMGGHAGGRQAGEAALEGFVAGYFGVLDGVPAAQSTSVSASEACCAQALDVGLQAASAGVERLIGSDLENLSDAGTTLLGVTVSRRSLQWVSVGDSVLWLWSGGKLRRLNADHSMRAVFARKVACGEMLAADVDVHPERNVLLSAVNGQEIPACDRSFKPVELNAGDIVIAASDGLLSLGETGVAAQVARMQEESAEAMVRELLRQVDLKKVRRQDNATVAVVRV